MQLLPHQLEVIQDRITHKKVLQGGYRSGKTWTACAQTIDFGFRSGGYPILVVEPTYKMIKDVYVATMERFLQSCGLPYRYNKSEHEFLIGRGNKFQVLCRSADNPRSLEGITAGAAIIDEWELCGAEALGVAFARVSMGDCQQILLTGTPEGFGPCYEMVLGNPNNKTKLWTVGTSVNTFLSADYIDNLRGNLDDSTALEKLEGVRTSKSGRVYSYFDRAKHNKPLVDWSRGRIAIACDFNVRYMHWLIALVDDDRRTVHFVGEVIKQGGTTTFEHAERTLRKIGELIKKNTGREYEFSQLQRHKYRAYCDASGSAQKSVSTESDLHLLLQAGFRVDCPNKNPPVKDRINTVQCLLRDNRISIDLANCPQFVKSLETQSWDKNGEPEKRDNVDHCCFISETLIETIEGPKRIDAITTEDLVLTRTGYKKVLRSWKTQENATVVKVSTSIGDIVCTSNHPFFSNGEFLPIDDIGYGPNLSTWQNQSKSLLITLVLKPVHLHAVEKLRGKRDVFNLEVEDTHEFFANGVLVHNCDAMGYLLNRLFPVHMPKANEPVKQEIMFDEWGITG